jgi:hypothetical protein
MIPNSPPMRIAFGVNSATFWSSATYGWKDSSDMQVGGHLTTLSFFAANSPGEYAALRRI